MEILKERGQKSFARSIHHPWPYFQCRLIQNNLQSETNIAHTKLKKIRNNSQKSRG